jgi:D-sedoheptulose 7-phosphate isomerase
MAFWQQSKSKFCVIVDIMKYSVDKRSKGINMKPRTQNIYEKLMDRYPILVQCSEGILKAYELLLSVVRCGGIILICGNGGSAADAEHITGELMKGFILKRPISDDEKAFLSKHFAETGKILSQKLQGAIPSISLVSTMSIITAVSNDNGGEFIFAQQVYGYCRNDSVLVAISTSGNSLNCTYAAMAAKLKGCPVIALTGESGGRLAEICDVLINAPSKITHEIQELHLPIYHVLCAMLESEIFEQ